MTYLKPTFHTVAYSKLFLPDFWINEQPSKWSAINYLTRLLRASPTTSKRDAHTRLSQDVNCMKKHVIEGTVAETVLNSMVTNWKSANGKAAIEKFWDNAESIAESSVEYSTRKEALRAQMADEVVRGNEFQRQRRKRKPDNVEESDEEDGNIWEEWSDFLNNPDNTTFLQALSPEKHGVIRCGKGVSRRFCLPDELYERLQCEIHTIEDCEISPSLQGYTDAVLDSKDQKEMQEANYELLTQRADVSLKTEVEFLTHMFDIFLSNVYDGQNMSYSETFLSSQLIWPSLKECRRLLRAQEFMIEFYPGEEKLVSMSTQLEKQGLYDKRFKYSAGGVLRFTKDLHTFELLLLETSSAYNAAAKEKASFDHYKGMYGLLAILKTIADTYPYADLSVFKKLKGPQYVIGACLFREPASSSCRKNSGLSFRFPLTKRQQTCYHYLQLFLNLTSELEKTIQTTRALETTHVTSARSSRYKMRSAAQSQLKAFVNPLIVRLSEGKHAKHLATEGPQSLPGSPSSS